MGGQTRHRAVFSECCFTTAYLQGYLAHEKQAPLMPRRPRAPASECACVRGEMRRNAVSNMYSVRETEETPRFLSRLFLFRLLPTHPTLFLLRWQDETNTRTLADVAECGPTGSMAFLQNQFRCPPMLGARRT